MIDFIKKHSPLIAQIIIIVLFIFLIAYLSFEARVYEEEHPCIVSHEEHYYDSSGTVLWVVNNIPIFLAEDGWKTRTVCDERK